MKTEWRVQGQSSGIGEKSIGLWEGPVEVKYKGMRNISINADCNYILVSVSILTLLNKSGMRHDIYIEYNFSVVVIVIQCFCYELD